MKREDSHRHVSVRRLGSTLFLSLCTQASHFGALLQLSSLANSNSPPALLGSESAAEWSGCTEQFFSRSAQMSETAGSLFACVCVSKRFICSCFTNQVLSIVSHHCFSPLGRAAPTPSSGSKTQMGSQPSGSKSPQSFKASKPLKSKTPADTRGTTQQCVACLCGP